MMLYLAEGGQDYEEDHQGPVQGGSLQHQAGPNAQAAQNCTLIYLGCYREPLLQQCTKCMRRDVSRSHKC